MSPGELAAPFAPGVRRSREQRTREARAWTGRGEWSAVPARARNSPRDSAERERTDLQHNTSTRLGRLHAGALCCLRAPVLVRKVPDEEASDLVTVQTAEQHAPQEVIEAVAVAVNLGVQLRAQPGVRHAAASHSRGQHTSRHRKKTASTVHSPSGGTPAV